MKLQHSLKLMTFPSARVFMLHVHAAQTVPLPEFGSRFYSIGAFTCFKSKYGSNMNNVLHFIAQSCLQYLSDKGEKSKRIM